MKKTVTCLVTDMCNLNCTYCYELNKRKRMLSLEKGRKVIQNELTAKNKFDEIEFSFFGGEPFLNFEVIKELYEYARSFKETEKRVCFSTITNGTILTSEIKDWLVAHTSDFIGTLSLDGTKKMQDMNRSKSFDDIDIDFFKKTYRPAYVKMTVSQLTLPNLAKGVEYLSEKGFRIACNLAYGISWTDENLMVLEEQLSLMRTYYLEHPEKELCSMLEFPYQQIAFAINNGKIYSCCSANRESCAYDLDGKRYPCHMFFPLNGSKEIHVEQLPFSEDGLVDPTLLDKKCYNCPISSVCQQCYGSNYLTCGNQYHVSEDMCKINKITFAAKAAHAADMWDRKLLHLTRQEEGYLLRAILSLKWHKGIKCNDS